MTLQRMSHAGAAPATTVSGGGFTATSTAFSIVSATGYPTGAGGPFVLKIDAGTASEEKILCASISGTTVTVQGGLAGRGFDNTVATAHGTTTGNVEHDFSAIEADDANDHIYTVARDDHLQYARVDGTRHITGPQIFNSTIEVVGAAQLDGNLQVNGTATLAAMSVGGVTATRIGGDTDLAWTAVTPANGWTNVGSPYRAAGFRLIDGKVNLRGVMASGTVGSPMFTLPVGYRPSASVTTGVDSPNTNAAGLLTIASSGTVIYTIGVGPLRVSLDNVSFDLL